MKKKKLFTVLICIIAILVNACTAVFGDVPSNVIDTERKGSLTLYKLRENSGNVENGDGTAKGTGGRTGIEGIGFTIMKIAEFEIMVGKDKTINVGAVADETEATIGNYFTGLDTGLIELFTDNGIDLSHHLVNDTICYSTEDLSAALIALCSLGSKNGKQPGEVQINNFVKNNSQVNMNLTDSNGMTTIGSLPLGLYLVAETNYLGYEKNSDLLIGDTYSKEIIANPSSPFLVSLPMSIQNGDKADSWQYDVVAYPKNQTTSISKYIVKQSDNDTLVQREDIQIGDIVHEVITVSAPAVAQLLEEGNKNREYEKFIIKDTMDAGLSVVKVNAVMIGPRIQSPNKVSQFNSFQRMTAKNDYTVYRNTDGDEELTLLNAKQSNGFRIEFSGDGLDYLNGITEDSQVVVLFDAILNKNAAVGQAEPNKNTPTLILKYKNTSERSIDGIEPQLFSYRLEILKQGVSDATKAGFNVSKNNEVLLFIKESNGIYHLYDNDFDSAGNKKTTLYPDSQGHLTIRGLDANTYEFTELSTESGHELLKSKFQVVLEGKNPVDGNLESATLISDNKQTSLAISKGTAGLTVKNFKSLILRTGGAGGKILMIGAAVSLLIFFVLFLAIRRRRGA